MYVSNCRLTPLLPACVISSIPSEVIGNSVPVFSVTIQLIGTHYFDTICISLYFFFNFFNLIMEIENDGIIFNFLSVFSWENIWSTILVVPSWMYFLSLWYATGVSVYKLWCWGHFHAIKVMGLWCFHTGLLLTTLPRSSVNAACSFIVVAPSAGLLQLHSKTPIPSVTC